MKNLLILLVGLEIWDGVLTYLLVSNGVGQESNPFLQPMVLGGSFLVLKICGGILAVFLLWIIYTRRPRAALICTVFFVVLYTVIVAWNATLFFTLS